MLNTMTETQRRAVAKAQELYEAALMLMGSDNQEDVAEAVSKRDTARAILKRAHVNVALDCH